MEQISAPYLMYLPCPTKLAIHMFTMKQEAEYQLLSVSEKTDTVKKLKKGEGGEEEVDIGDEMPMSSFPPVEIEKDDGGRDNGHASSSSSSSSSSGSDSSSSSDSDSGSSSGSDSDADDAQSRGLKSKELSKT
ncbi:hypothetical protein TEA_002105 [Camellia sinensis var. sinensis]|uniref:Uncharacterized protein n=1 Tax=Camellia sinensis var. sinensis TaxID=542762 RepID=A0A4S4DCP2_CAMSN|nr:hypothetical protein TEA_002105 [Camellia sinensis var. sinensis]